MITYYVHGGVFIADGNNTETPAFAIIILLFVFNNILSFIIIASYKTIVSRLQPYPYYETIIDNIIYLFIIIIIFKATTILFNEIGLL